MYDMWYGLWWSLENSKKFSKKTLFFGFFQSFFGHTLPCPTGDALFFFQVKGIMKIHNHSKFYLYSICGCQFTNFQIFSWRCSIHELSHFGVFLDPNSPEYGSVLLKFASQVLFMKTKTVFQKFLENSDYYRNCTLPKF